MSVLPLHTEASKTSSCGDEGSSTQNGRWSTVKALCVRNAMLFGLLLYAVSVFFNTLMSATAKMAQEAGMPVFQVVLMRSIILVLYTSPQMVYHKFNPLQGPNMRRFVGLLRGITGFGAVALMFMAVQLLPFSEANMLSFLAPVFVALLAPIFLKEPFNWAVLVALPLCVGGVIMVAQPASIFARYAAQTLSAAGVAVAIAQAFSSGTSKMCIRYLCRTDPAYSAMWAQGVVSTVLSLVICAAVPGQRFVNPGGRAWGLTMATGVLGIFNQITGTVALEYAPAAATTAMTYTAVIWGLVFDIAFFNHFPNGFALGGGLLIVVTTLALTMYMQWQKRRDDKQKEVEQQQNDVSLMPQSDSRSIVNSSTSSRDDVVLVVYEEAQERPASSGKECTHFLQCTS